MNNYQNKFEEKQEQFIEEQFEYYITQGYSNIKATKLAREDFWRAVDDGFIK